MRKLLPQTNEKVGRVGGLWEPARRENAATRDRKRDEVLNNLRDKKIEVGHYTWECSPQMTGRFERAEKLSIRKSSKLTFKVVEDAVDGDVRKATVVSRRRAYPSRGQTKELIKSQITTHKYWMWFCQTWSIGNIGDADVCFSIWQHNSREAIWFIHNSM